MPIPLTLEQQLERSLHQVRAKKVRMTEQSQAIVTYQEPGPLEFTNEQRAMIRDTYAAGASEKEFQVLLEVAKIRRLNPLLKQIHFMQRWNPDLERKVWVSVVGIDGFRALADRTRLYGGQDEPEYGPTVNGFPEFCKVRVYRKGWERPAVGVAYWSEYVQLKRDGKPTRSWATMSHTMIAKCAEAQALRKAFPEDLGGLYAPEELDRDQEAPREALNPHVAPGEDQYAPAKEHRGYEQLMEALRGMDVAVFDPGCTWETMNAKRSQLGRKGSPTPFSTMLSNLYQSDDIGPGQKKEISALWNRVDRKLTALEGKLKPPPVESSFIDPDDADGTEVLGAREPGSDDE